MPEPGVLVIGLGYVGLPLAVHAARAGFAVTGYDTSERITAGLNEGRSHVDDISDADVAEMLARGFRATSDETQISSQDVIVICVPTPLSEADGPDLTYVRKATETAGALLRQGALVSLESTTYPGTTDEVVRPLLEKASGLTAGIGFSLAFSPERIDPGNPVYGLKNTPKVVGGVTPACADAAAAFYREFCDTVVKAKSAREAEMAKLLENTYRHVNIALVNEMAIFCRELGVDLWDAIRCASTKPFGYQPFYPGPGVGGHCIPIDPNYLSYKVRTLGYPFRFVELAQEINARMPGYVTERAAELLNRNAKPVNGAGILLLGVTYKRDIADQRESPARPLARKLASRGARVSYHDPLVTGWRVDDVPVTRAGDLDQALAEADLVILLQASAGYDPARLAAHARLLLDTRGVVPAAAHVEALLAMRVLVCTIVHHPQDARIFHRQIRALLDAGHEVTYLSPEFSPERPVGSLHLSTLPRATGRRRLGALLAARRQLTRYAPESDIVLLHDPELLLALPRVRRPATVWDVHEDTAAALRTKPWLPRPLRPPTAMAVHAAERIAERRLHLILAEQGYADRFRKPHPVVPNTTYVPEALAPYAGDRRVVYVGHLSPDRGAAEMAELAGLLRPHGITVELIGPADARARSIIEASPDVRWHGFIPNDEAMRHTDGALAGLSLLRDEPNFRHSMPTKVVEYMARGVPVITTPLPAAADLAARYDCGYVVPFGDPAAAAAAILELDSDPALRDAMGARGHAAARDSLGWPADAKAFVAQLEEWAGCAA
jgi:UDP-N-acetyl-D-glucosamine dehydrogenase